jgi:hypothetical protein
MNRNRLSCLMFIFASVLWVACLHAADPADAKTPGLVGAYYMDLHTIKALTQTKADPFFVRTDPQIDFADVEGDFYGSHLTTNFGVKWTGTIHIDKPSVYQFHLLADDLAALTVNQKLVIASAKAAAMTDRRGEMSFDAAGDFPIEIDFIQLGGKAGCQLLWQPPGVDKAVAVPADVLSHSKAAENIKWSKDDWNLFAFDHMAWLKKFGHKWEKMDYGPFLSGTFIAPFPEHNTTLKGIIVSLDKEHSTNILFDTQMCRYSAGWTGGYIDFHNVAYDGAHGATNTIVGTQIFGTPVMPGWEHDGSFKDPRDNPYKNLPEDWCHYRGLYRCGDEIVFSYTVNGVGVLDSPRFVSWNGGLEFSRRLRIDPTDQALTLVVGEASSQDTEDTFQDVGDVKFFHSADHKHILVTIPPHKDIREYQIPLGPLAPRRIKGEREDPINMNEVSKGGPARWGEPLVTQGKLGTGDGPYVIDTLTPPDKNPYDAWLRFAGFDFFPDGHSAAISTWNGDVWIVKGIDDKLDHLTWQRYATGMFQTLGLKIVNGEVYVLGRDQITRLHDLNGDGEADFYENFNNDCQVTPGFHEFAHDLQVDSQGDFFYAKGGPVRPGGNGFEAQSDDNGCIMEVSPDGKKCQVYASGLRAPNGMSMGPNDQMTVSDNQGTWVPACRINFVTRGSFLGVPDTSHLNPKPTNYGNPICWFPYAGNGNQVIDNSSGGAAWDLTDKWGPMDGKIIHLSYSSCCMFELMTENIDGIWQGGAVKFPLNFDSGVMRARFNPVDGQLYVAGLKGWQTSATEDGCFQRVRYTGKQVNMPSQLHVLKDALAITFTNPVDPKTATDSDNYNIEQWNYIWSNSYGSPDVSRDDPKKKGHDTVDIGSLTLSPDHKTLFVKIADLKPVMQMKVIMKIKAADGAPMNWEVDNTINVVPGQKPIATIQPTEH